MDWEKFDSEFEKALVKFAELRVKGFSEQKIIEKFVEDKDLIGLYFTGYFIGASNGLHLTEYAVAVIHNLELTIEKLKEGVSKETILKELENVRKWKKRSNLMTYGC